MKPQKAIEILEVERHLAERQPETGLFNALGLGSEALKRLEILRQFPTYDPNLLLPGEDDGLL